MIGTAGLPHVLVRFFTVRKVRHARASAGYALLFIAILYTTAPAVGALARLNLTTTIQTGPVFEETANLSYKDRPAWFRTWEDTGLLRFEDKNGDGRIQYYNDANPEFAERAEANGWRGNELTVDRDIVVLANPEIAGLPDWVIALVAAGGIAAALSTAAGLLLVISAAVSHDLIKSVFVRNISDRAELRAGRISAGLAVLLAGYLGYNPPGFVAEVVALAFGLAAASLFPPSCWEFCRCASTSRERLRECSPVCSSRWATSSISRAFSLNRSPPTCRRTGCSVSPPRASAHWAPPSISR